jgi:type IV pilus assembly protein PilB
MARKLLGAMLVEEGVITEAQLERALEEQKKERKDPRISLKRRLGHILTDSGYITSDKLGSFLEKQLHFPYLDLKGSLIEPEVVKLLDPHICRRHQFIPLVKENNILTIVMTNPGDIPAIEDIKFITGWEIKIMLSPEKVLFEALTQYYGQSDQMKDITEKVTSGSEEVTLIEEEEMSLEELQKLAGEAPVVKIVNYMIMEAIGQGATDIHIESFEDRMRLRYRVDGILHEVTAPPKRVQSGIVSRIKIMANLNIAERRLPQDGRITIKVEDRKVDLRVSVVNTVYGEKIMLRILDRGAVSLNLEILGFEPEGLEIFRKGIARPYGILLVTGPTGCGKTTTLYAGLKEIYSPGTNMITIEEPVEYELQGINQVQTNNDIGLTFASALRHFLRQDPDIIMVGEIRDYETAEIAIRAALTGHLVLSTVHTNDAPSTVVRLTDLGIPPFLVVASVHMVASQRLIHQICPKCREAYKPAKELLEKAGFARRIGKDIQLYRGRGCESCGHLGYKGRLGVFEIMSLNTRLNELIMDKAPPHILRRAARKMGMTTLGENAFRKALEGLTTIEEVLRVSLEEEVGEAIDE